MLSEDDSSSLLSAQAAFLLGRPLRSIPVEAGKKQLAGARVLVTGAGGSVGRALIASFLPLQPARIIALDHHEASLFRLGQAVGGDPRLELRLGDVRNADKLRRLCAESQPTLVFHLAAYKHVPLAEREPDEPISVNVLGTSAVAEAAIETGANHVVYPSSDKAVNPPSLYGATKRIAETMLLARSAQQNVTAFHVVRYVNIIGTSGSVIETFARQLRSGAPLPLTDPRMTRYWMAMEEAIGLLWHALALPTASRTLLDTGPPVPVQTMAERVCQLIQPDGPPPRFVVTGARPGERLAEELASASETLAACGDDPVWRVLDARRTEHAQLVGSMVDELRSLLSSASSGELHARAMEFARQLQ